MLSRAGIVFRLLRLLIKRKAGAGLLGFLGTNKTKLIVTDFSFLKIAILISFIWALPSMALVLELAMENSILSNSLGICPYTSFSKRFNISGLRIFSHPFTVLTSFLSSVSRMFGR